MTPPPQPTPVQIEALGALAKTRADADYAVAKEKCDALSGDAKDGCVNEAKKHYGK